jgi:hypothetical protein
MLSCESLKSK